MHGEDRLNIKTQLIVGALKLAEFPDHISIDYGSTNYHSGTHKCIFPDNIFFLIKYVEAPWLRRPLGNCPACPFLNPALGSYYRSSIAEVQTIFSARGEKPQQALTRLVRLDNSSTVRVSLYLKFCRWLKVRVEYLWLVSS